MRIRTVSAVLAFLITALLLNISSVATAADVSGTLQINKKKVKLTHGYLDMMKPEEPVIVLSDKAIPAEYIPFIGIDYADKNKVHAVVFIMDRKSKKFSEGRWVYFGGDAETGFVVFDAEKATLELKQADDTIIEGRVRTPKPEKRGDVTFSFDISFKLSAKAAIEKATAPRKISFSGDDSAPVKAYKEYCRAIMAGNTDGMKNYMAAKNLKEFEAMDAKEREMVLGILQMRPEKLKLDKPSISGDQATFKATGKEGSDDSTGSIKMINEGGAWKVLEDKWQTISK
ncbi:MAG: DUF4878 domain-containing protein [Nitrospirae bacterium]|nr:DUF4878 domain-containing protein [Nitrospirota bacterium]